MSLSLPVIAGVTAGILDTVSFIPYIHSILKGKTKPNRASFGIWTGVSFILLASYFSSGARETIWFVLSYSFWQLIVFALSFKYGVGGLNRLDITCIIGAFIGAILWLATDNPELALYTSLAVEIMGFIPTIKKSYLFPETENTFSWTVSVIGASINMLAVTSFVLHIALYPFALLVCNGIIAFFLHFPSKSLRRRTA